MNVFSFLAHGVHLAVSDIMYNCKSRSQLSDAFNDSQEEETAEENVDQTDDGKDDDEDFQMTENFILQENPDDDVLPDLTHKYQPLITNIREIVKFFRNSPLRMEYLQESQKKVQEEKREPAKEVNLVLDVRTRWNSIIAMLDSVFKVKICLSSEST